MENLSKFFPILLVIANICGCKTSPPAPVKQTWKTGEQTVQYSFPSGEKVLFPDDDTLVAWGEGVSREGLRTELQHIAVAKEQARMDAQSAIVAHCSYHSQFAGMGCCSMAYSDELFGRKAERSQRLKPMKVRQSICTADTPEKGLISCRVVLQVSSKQIRQFCESERNGGESR